MKSFTRMRWHCPSRYGGKHEWGWLCGMQCARLDNYQGGQSDSCNVEACPRVRGPRPEPYKRGVRDRRLHGRRAKNPYRSGWNHHLWEHGASHIEALRIDRQLGREKWWRGMAELHTERENMRMHVVGKAHKGTRIKP